MKATGLRTAHAGSSTLNSHSRKTTLSSSLLSPILVVLITSLLPCVSFNLYIPCRDDIYAEDSIELLKTSGIDFEKFDRDGIDVHYFGELMTMSGLVLNEKVKWVSFHSSYDFGYLMKVLTCAELPMDEQTFLELLHIFFPYIYDVKVSITKLHLNHSASLLNFFLCIMNV